MVSEGKLTSSKWAKLTKSSQDMRDITDLVQRGILVRSEKAAELYACRQEAGVIVPVYCGVNSRMLVSSL